MKQIIIYHSNDTHARINTLDDNSKTIGFDKIAKVINLSLLKNPNTFYFHAGDLIHGTPRINITQGNNIVNLLNLLHLDALCPGNHEWNFGREQLLSITSKLNAHVLSANTIDKETNYPILLPYIIYNVDLNCDDYVSINSNYSKEDNIKIGVFGLSTPETAYKTNPNNVKTVKFTNPITAAKNVVNLLKNTCHIIIALTHLGLDESSEFTSKKLVEQVDGIDLCIDGHSHTILPHGLRVNNTLIVQAGSHDNYLGQIFLNFQDKQLVNITASLLDEEKVDQLLDNTSDQLMLNKLNEIDVQANKILNKTIAYSNKSLSGERAIVRCQENELGNFTANACRYVTKADISVINGGDIRTSLPKGNITYNDILAIFPFQNKIGNYQVTGKVLKNMMEHSLEFLPAAFGGFLSVSSNVNILYDDKLPPKQRVKNILINNEPIQDNKLYILSMPTFLADGGDDYTMFSNIPLIELFGTTEEIFLQYIKEHSINEIDYQLGRLILA